MCTVGGGGGKDVYRFLSFIVAGLAGTFLGSWPEEASPFIFLFV